MVCTCFLVMIEIALVMAFRCAGEAYWEAVALRDESRDKDQIPVLDSDRKRQLKKSLKKRSRKSLARLVALIVGLIACCALVVGIVCAMFDCVSSLQEREANAKEGVQEAFAEAGYQVFADGAVPLPVSRYGKVTTINEPVLSSDGSEIAPKGSLAYYISEDGRTVRIYKDGAEIAAVNGEE